MFMKIEEILEKIGKDVLSEETKKTISQAFTGAVDALVKERIDIEVKAALDKMDEEHVGKLHSLVEKIDTDYSGKLVQVVNSLNKNHAEKLKIVIEKYESMLKDEALKFRDQMIGEVSNYLELYLNKIVPSQQIAEAAENVKSKRLVEKMKKILAVDDEFVIQSISEAVKDGKSTIEDLQKELNEALKENIRINQDLKKANAALILEKKCADLPEKKSNYVMRLLGDKTPQEIEENFTYVVEMFERDETEESVQATDQAKQKWYLLW